MHCTNPYLGNTLVSLFSYVCGDMPQVHTGYPSGMVPGAQPGLLLLVLDGRNNSIACHPCHYIRSTDRLCSADHQVAPSGVIDPPRISPEILPGLLAYVSCMLEFPPQVGVLGGVPMSTPAAVPPQTVISQGCGKTIKINQLPTSQRLSVKKEQSHQTVQSEERTQQH
jgi:hypothetical protein